MSRRANRRQFMQVAAGGAAAALWAGCAPFRSSSLLSDSRFRIAPVDWTRWPEVAQVAIDRLRAVGCSYGDIRMVETRGQSISAEDRAVAGVSDRSDAGYGIRALYRGAWGFSAGADFREDAVRRAADLASEVARASATLVHTPVRLVAEPVHVDRVRTVRRMDPFAVPLRDRCALLTSVCEALHDEPAVVRSNAWLWAQHDVKHFASTDGSRIDFDLLAVGGRCGVAAVGADDVQTREFVVPFARAGYEHILEHDMVAHAPRVAAEAVEKVRARTVAPGAYDLVLDPGNLALTIHETCGHPSELDRAADYSADYAGTSFLTPDKRGAFRYGSDKVNLVADNTRPGGLASTGYDDDGVACQRWPIVEAGVFVGYATNREAAGAIGAERSRGCGRADGWRSIPLVRAADVGLEPGADSLDGLIGGVDDGIYIEGRGSFSADQDRYRFRFGGDACWEIRNGRRGPMLRNVVFQGVTPEFWGRCDGVGNSDAWRPHGFISCGKGQPGQFGWMTHGAPPARFRGVQVISPRT